MDRRGVIEQLESVRRFCESMLQKDGSIVWRNDAEALTEAIKALSIVTNKNQKGDMDMTSEVKVTIVAHDGTVNAVTGDTVICFAVSNIMEFLNGKSKGINAQEAFVGNTIPTPFFPTIMAALVSALVKAQKKEKPLEAAFTLYKVSQLLKAESERLQEGITKSQLEAEIGEFLKAMF